MPIRDIDKFMKISAKVEKAFDFNPTLFWPPGFETNVLWCIVRNAAAARYELSEGGDASVTISKVESLATTMVNGHYSDKESTKIGRVAEFSPEAIEAAVREVRKLKSMANYTGEV